MSVINRPDLNFLLHEWLDLQELIDRPRFAAHDVAGIDLILSLAQQLAEQELAPHLRASDVVEPSLDGAGRVHVLPDVARAVRLIADSGLFGSVFDEELGGLQLPNLVYIAAMGILMSATIATPSFMLLTVANARLIAACGSPMQAEYFAKPQIAGTTMGTMCLSEPQAGSSLGDIRTRARPDGEDALGQRYRIFGNKMWISAGDHDVTSNIVHLVLAKVPDESGELIEGPRGISLFIVPKILPDGSENDISVAGLNHKMGYRGLPNCALNFGEGRMTPGGAPGATGWLVGEVGRGLSQMFQMMNEARIAVGMGATALAGRGFLMSLDYARTRLQGRSPGVKSGPPVPIAEHADVKRMLLAQKAYAEGALALVLYSARLLDDETTAATPHHRADAAELLALLTPVTKSWPSEWAQQSLDYAIQILGGAGYTRDFEIEQLYRDNRLNPIHEGTTGIQAVDLVGRKLRKGDGESLRLLRGKVSATIDAARSAGGIAKEADAVEAAWIVVDEAVAILLGEEDDARAIIHATPFLFAFGHAVIGWIWLDLAALCRRTLDATGEQHSRSYLEGKLRAARYFAEFELPKVSAWLEPLRRATDVTATMPIEQFLGEAP